MSEAAPSTRAWLVVDRLPTSLRARWPQQPFVAIERRGDGSICLPDGTKLDGAILADALDPANPALQDSVDDIAKLSHLNEPCLYHLVSVRFLKRRLIYSCAGPVLVVLNPFTPVPELYSHDVLTAYHRGSLDPEVPSPPPHVYGIAAAAFQGLLSRATSQSICINGESGAGKTESCKKILAYLTFVAASASSAARMRSESLAQQLHATNPLLEAFGNAKTLRNDNSSRFGKFVQLQFSGGGSLQGASVERYLLEKSRVTGADPEERTFHVLYQLTAGAPDALREVLRLPQPSSALAPFVALERGGCREIPGVDDAAEFAIFCAAFRSLLPPDAGALATADFITEEALWSCVAALLHLCNVVFTDSDETDGAGGGGAAAAVVKDPSQALEAAASLWQVDAQALETALTRRTIAAGAELCELRKSVAESAASRDALARGTYERTFDALIGLINLQLAADRGDSGGRQVRDGAGGCIALLDIFGSEVFECNGFEQLLINYANERLQQLFTATAIARVQAEYASENLPWERIEYTDNAAVLSLLEGRPTSILACLDDQGLIAGSTDEGFVALLEATFAAHPAFSVPRVPEAHAGAQFVVHHYAGSVTYSAEHGFLQKNRDAVYQELPALMRTSTIPFVQHLFLTDHSRPAAHTPPAGAASGAGADGAKGGAVGRRRPPRQTRVPRSRSHYASVSAQFRDSMARLAASLDATSCHFIRCIKSNERRAPFTLSPALALSQLRSCGVLEAARVSQAGFPNRIPFAELVHGRYAILLPRSAQGLSRAASRGRIGTSSTGFDANGRGSPPPLERRGSSTGLMAPTEAVRSQAGALLNALNLDKGAFMLGRTMAFLRVGVLAVCEAARAQKLHQAVVSCQAHVRGHLAAARYRATKQAAKTLGRAGQRMILRREGERMRRRMIAEEEERQRTEAEERERRQREAAEVAEAAEAAEAAEVAEAAQAEVAQAAEAARREQAAAAAAEQAAREAAERAEAARAAREAELEMTAAEAQAEASRLTMQLATATAQRETAEARVEDSLTSIMALAWAQQELGATHRDLEATQKELAGSQAEAAGLRREVTALRDAKVELEEDLEAEQEERSELEELNYSYEAQLEDYEAQLERRDEEVDAARDQLAGTQVELASAREASLRLLREVSWLREKLEERDEELRTAARKQVELVEQFSTQESMAFESRKARGRGGETSPGTGTGAGTGPGTGPVARYR